MTLVLRPLDSTGRREQMEGILGTLEHVWKMHREMTLGEVLVRVLGEDALTHSDAQTAMELRQYLQRVMGRAKDET